MAAPSKNRSTSHARHARASCVALAASIFIEAHAAHAAPPSLRTDDVPACPSAADLRASIAADLGRDPFERSDAPRVDVRVGAKDGALWAEVLVERAGAPPRSRVLTGDDCRELVRAAALVAALAIEEEPAPPAPAPTQAPTPNPPPATPPSREGREEPVAPARSLGRDRAAIVALGTTSVGLLPRPAAGVGADARVRVAEAVWISARALYLPPAAMPDDTFAARLWAAGAGACWEPFASARAAAFGCAHVLGGALAVSSSTVAMRDGGAKAFVAAAASVGARVRVVGPVIAFGAVETVLPFSHPTLLTATCPASGFQQPFAALAPSLGAGVSIP